MLMVERRSIGRTSISKSALLFFDEQRGVFTCHVRDITKGGAGFSCMTLMRFPSTLN
jgi:hypothetical protein